MKNYKVSNVLTLVACAVAFAFITGCEGPAGEVGPKGDTGDSGTTGAPGAPGAPCSVVDNGDDVPVEVARVFRRDAGCADGSIRLIVSAPFTNSSTLVCTWSSVIFRDSRVISPFLDLSF